MRAVLTNLTNARGSSGGVTAITGGKRAVLRVRHAGTRKNTTLAQSWHNVIRLTSSGWGGLTPLQRKTWELRADLWEIATGYDPTIFMSGFQCFVSFNAFPVQHGLGIMFKDAPEVKPSLGIWGKPEFYLLSSSPNTQNIACGVQLYGSDQVHELYSSISVGWRSFKTAGGAKNAQLRSVYFNHDSGRANDSIYFTGNKTITPNWQIGEYIRISINFIWNKQPFPVLDAVVLIQTL